MLSFFIKSVANSLQPKQSLRRFEASFSHCALDARMELPQAKRKIRDRH
jgi:hypothetical protein